MDDMTLMRRFYQEVANERRLDAIDIVRVVDGQAVEHWGVTDDLGLLRQPGGSLSARPRADSSGYETGLPSPGA